MDLPLADFMATSAIPSNMIAAMVPDTSHPGVLRLLLASSAGLIAMGAIFLKRQGRTCRGRQKLKIKKKGKPFFQQS